MKPVIFISGISSGLGFAIAKFLSAEYQIVGSLRSIKDLEIIKLNIPDLIPIYLDFNDLVELEEAINNFLLNYPELKIFAIINNAGIAVPGPLLDLPIDQLQTQFRVNVFGHFLLIQKLFHRLIPTKSRIINMSSVSGLFASPFLGAYAGSKFALEGMTDALRRELRLLGIKVILIEPGPIKTQIWRKSLGLADKYPNSLFNKYLTSADELILQTEENALDVSKIISPIQKSLKHKQPKNRYIIHRSSLLIKLMANIIPSQWVDYLVHKNLSSNKRKIRPI